MESMLKFLTNALKEDLIPYVIIGEFSVLSFLRSLFHTKRDLK